MRQPLLFLHLLGLALWMGGGLAAMAVGAEMRRLPRTELAGAMRIQGALVRALSLPGAILVVLTGLMLTLSLYGSATSVGGFPKGLMLMQGAGLLGPGLTLVVTVPVAARLQRLDPTGPHAPLFDALRRRAALAGMLSSVLGLLALAGGAMMR